ncbi:MAG: hypothetical protein M3O99_00675 [Chloroflexota bacterium]|nr:hypothetical protein [Chloroflexota bacterium]
MGALVLRGAAGGEHPLTLRERVLYHQIHPAKLFADVATALVAIDLFWRHALAPGLIIALLPPVLVSAVLVREANLESYRSSPMGAYLRRFMPPWVQAVRLFGVALAFYASWHHVPAGIYGGLALVALCWANGLVRDAARRAHDIHDKAGIDVWRA